jgi:hypothetical protein
MQMTADRVREIVRQFPQNGMKLLLHNPQNVHDLLNLAGSEWAGQIDFREMAVDPTNYVGSDFRHVESDLVLTAPLRGPGGRRSRRRLTVSILIEHQSEPDRLMILRVLDYLVQIWKAQVRTWGQRHGSFASVRLQPILPVVFYTGVHRWERIGNLVDLIDGGEPFRRVTPGLEPLFVNLPGLARERLESAGGFFGWVLELVQRREARAQEFQESVRRVVQHLEAMAPVERLRWLELLSYIHALVYHERGPAERPALLAAIEASVNTDDHRQGVADMRRTIADYYRDEGAVLAKREVLLRLMRRKFGKVPAGVKRAVEATADLGRLDSWLDHLVTAGSLEEMAIEDA